MGFSRTFLPIKAENQNLPQMQSLPSTSTSTSISNIHGSKIMLWWEQKSLVYYELLKPGDSITGDRYRLQLIRLSRALKRKTAGIRAKT